MNIQCIKCYKNAWGKCPKCRTVFDDDNSGTEECKHDFHYKKSGEKCIYGCGYVSAGQF